MNPDQADPDFDSMQAPPPSSSRTRADVGARAFPSGVIPTEVLFQGNQEILISHHGEHYRLRITRNGKLILTK